jgi:RHS repeat-associated protein
MTTRDARISAVLRTRWAVPVVIAQILAQLWCGIPVSAQTRRAVIGTGHPWPTARPVPTVKVNRTVPAVSPPSSQPTFSADPTDAEITRARVFAEALVPVGRTTIAENRALAAAIRSHHEASGGSSAPFVHFLGVAPATAWRPSLLVNLGRDARSRGEFSLALSRWEEAWRLTRDDTTPAGTIVAADSMGEMLAFASDLGHVPMLERRLAELGERTLSGPAGERVAVARATLRTLQQHPEHVVACGRQAMAILWTLVNGSQVPGVLRTPGRDDVTLGDLQALGRQAGLPVDAVVRPAEAEPVVPSVVHLSIGHYVVLAQTDGDRYLLRAPGLGGELWVTRDALAHEISGYCLVPVDRRPHAWRVATADEAATIKGRSVCPPGPPEPNEPPCPCGGTPDPKTGECCQTCSDGAGGNGNAGNCRSSCGMPVHSIDYHSASLLLTDTPVVYTPARGPSASFTLTYHSRQSLHPQVPVYGWLGPRWTHNWLAYALESPAYCQGGLSTTNDCFPAAVTMYLRGGGVENHHTPDANGVYPVFWLTNAQVVRVSASPVRYERRLPSGDVEVFGLADTAPEGSRRVFLTEVRDAQGQAVTLTYDAQYRVVGLTDALGQVTTLAYEEATDPLRLTRVTDPFGRIATFAYNAAGELSTLTDSLGLTSRVAYGADSKVVLLTTPYGTTTFRHGGDFYEPTLEVGDADGGTERIEYRWDTDGWGESEPASDVPAEFAAANTRLNTYTTVHWTPQAWAAGPGVLANATLTRWLARGWAPLAPVRTVGVPHSIKRPLERRVWYAYPDQPGTESVGRTSQPSVVARVLDDGTVQRTAAAYNDAGQVTSRTDPIGRQTTYTYAPNGTDLLEVRQTTAGGSDLLAQYGHYTAGHQTQTVTDAAGQATTITYNAAGQVLTSTNAKQETTSYAYDTDGRLQSVTAPVAGATTAYTYDGYGRVRTVTGPDGYAVTTDYDVFDRPTRVTYPDGTYEETTYDRLDVATRRDRLGRITRTFHDSLRRVTGTRDPAGRLIQQQWGAGGLAKLIDAKGQATTWERDVQGRVTREVRADGVTATVYAYQPASGRLATVTDPKGQVTTYGYATDDSVIGMTYTNAVIQTPGVVYTYDPVYPRVATMVDGTGTTSYTYHPAGSLGAGHVASVDGPLTDDTITYAYDELGRVVSRAINGAANTTTQVYDALGRVTSETNVLGTFTYAYIGVTGRLQLVTYPNGQTSSYAYFDSLSDQRLQTIHHQRPGGATLSRFDYTYDAAGNILTWLQQADSDAPTLWTYGYDRADQLTSAVHQTTGGTPSLIKRYAYSYDPAGNRTSEQIDDAVTVDTHDRLNRLLTKSPGGPLLFKGTLNEPGRVTINGVPATVSAVNAFQASIPVTVGTNTVTINAVDASGNTTEAVYEVDQAGAGKTFTYDANGNMTSDGTRTFEWDARNQLVAIRGDSFESHLTYNGQGQQVVRTEVNAGTTASVSRLVWVGERAVEERFDGSSGSTRLFAQGIEDAGIAYYYTRDRLTSIREMTDWTAAVRARYEYDPYGRQAVIGGDLTSRHGFDGLLTAKTEGLVQARYRTYAPEAGRWLSADPAGPDSASNEHRFVAARVTTLMDPDGRQGIDPYNLPKAVARCFCTLWRNAQYGHARFEWGAAIMVNTVDYYCVSSSTYESAQTSIPILSGMVGMVHTHPTKNAEQRPSDPKDYTCPTIPRFVITRSGIHYIPPGCHKPKCTEVIEKDDWYDKHCK